METEYEEAVELLEAAIILKADYILLRHPSVGEYLAQTHLVRQ